MAHTFLMDYNQLALAWHINQDDDAQVMDFKARRVISLRNQGVEVTSVPTECEEYIDALNGLARFANYNHLSLWGILNPPAPAGGNRKQRRAAAALARSQRTRRIRR